MVIPESFPDARIIDAYMNPNVDTSSIDFEWGAPDLNGIRKFMWEKVGWNTEKVNNALLPAIKASNNTNNQSHITEYFKNEVKPIKSKRLLAVLEKLKNKTHQNKSEETKTKIRETKRKGIQISRPGKKQK